MTKYDENTKELLSAFAVAIFFIFIAVVSASIAVGVLCGAGYGFAVFGACMFLFGLWYARSAVKSAKMRKEKGCANNAEYLNQILTVDDKNTPTITVIKGGNDD